jgi:hypothetical protein
MRVNSKNLYWTLFAIESAGMAAILYEALPVYRKLINETVEKHPGRPVLVPVLCIVVMMQACYWLKFRKRPSIGRLDHPLVGHLFLFSSRLSFIFAGSLFSLTLFRQVYTFREALPGMLVLLAATFAQFCYARELEMLARRFEKSPDPARRA